MGFISDIFAGGTAGLMEGAKGLISQFKLAPKQAKEFELGMESLLQKRDSEIEHTIRAELDAKSKIIEAEMKQDDNYTKRARPTVVYVGLAVIVLNYCIAPIIAHMWGKTLPELQLPTEFWVAWGGIVATWAVGRSAEKRGVRNKVTNAITGSNTLSSLID